VLLVLSIGASPLVSLNSAPSYTEVVKAGLMPWSWLANLPVLGALLPNRLSLVADGAAAALLAFGIDFARARLCGRQLDGQRVGGTRLGDTTLGRRGVTAAVAAVAAVAVLPLVPLPLQAQAISPQPAGWTATLSAMRLPAGARVLAVPFPTALQTDVLRWQAEGGQQISLIGGYFEGPFQGHAYIDGAPQTALATYLNYVWNGRPASWNPPNLQAPSRAATVAILRWWRPQAIVADAKGRPALAQYLRQLFGRPQYQFGTMIGWRCRTPTCLPR
jgi:hypothetical protein